MQDDALEEESPRAMDPEDMHAGQVTELPLPGGEEPLTELTAEHAPWYAEVWVRA